MVLANGQYMFTCSGDGSFDLNVPLDGNGQITVYAFCSNLAPFRQIISPSQSKGFRIDLDTSEGGTDMDVDFSTTDLGGGKVRLDGTIRYNGNPVCAMVLANGQYAFTCSGDGSFRLDVPLDGNGEITLYGFCSGLPPYRYIFQPTTGGTSDGFTMADLAGNWRITVDAQSAEINTNQYYIDVTLNSGGSLSYTEFYYGYAWDSSTGSWSYNNTNRYFIARGDGDLCRGTIASGATVNAFSVPGTFYDTTGTYNWVRR
jgi:hypothetical protein